MATSGSYNTNLVHDGPDNKGLTFSWTRTSYSIANNTSTISWTLKGRGSSGWMLAQNFKQTVNGANYENNKNIQLRAGTVALSGTTVITHNADGSKSFSAVS